MQQTEKMRIVIADDMAIIRSMLSINLSALGYIPILTANGKAAFEEICKNPPDLIISDINMPEMNGYDLLKTVKSDKSLRHIPVIMISSIDEIESIARCIEYGAEDYLDKSEFSDVILKARIESSLAKKKLHDQEVAHHRTITAYNATLEQRVQEGVRRAIEAENAIVFALAKLAESRDPTMGQHLERIQIYCRILAEQLRKNPTSKDMIDDVFVRNITVASPLHDIGKAGIPDIVLLKPGKLTSSEFDIMKGHVHIGARALADLLRNFPGNSFLMMGIQIAESHHEKWDGSGYPHGISGDAIPLAARILALADVYDALTSERCYKKAFSHQTSCSIILESKGSHFDPDLVDIFRSIQDIFQHTRQTYDGFFSGETAKSA
jgi:putative two-component system response regulator